LIGFWPYFLQAQRSEGTSSPLGLPLAAGGAGMHTTFLSWFFLQKIEHLQVTNLIRKSNLIITLLIYGVQMLNLFQDEVNFL
jgi:hypothetical protein